ncbi:hypothetical protein M433DRAFT_160555 [Acidomyces richmondensis BFW]|nr:hypothetical protein M433DRAFT_160555 [Acidomyces richmondensis BFW]
MEMEIDSEGPTTPKRIIGCKRPIETLQRPRANRARRDEEEEEEEEEKEGEKEEEINREKEKEVLSLIYKARDLIVKAVSLTKNR